MLENLEEYIEQKYINVNTHELDAEYKIYNYSQFTQYKRFWNDTTKACRGLITRKGEIISRGPSKFFNYDEIVQPPVSDIVGVYEKVDGSLGIPYELNGSVYLATKGSFASEQARMGTEILNENYDEFLVTLVNDLLDIGITPIFEIIYPENQIVVNYGKREELIFIGTVDNKTGLIDYEKYREEFEKLCTVVKKHTIEDPIPEKTEGFVVQFKDGTCAKIKSYWYMNLHRLVADKDFYRMTLESLINNDDMEWLNDIPDEFYQEIEKHRKDVERKVSNETTRLVQLLTVIKEQHSKEKDIALRIKEFPNDMSFLFPLWRKGTKVLREVLLKSLMNDYRKSNNS